MKDAAVVITGVLALFLCIMAVLLAVRVAATGDYWPLVVGGMLCVSAFFVFIMAALESK